MFYQVKSYFLFLLKSTTKYGVHSPFVFNLITNCFNSKQNIQKVKDYKALLHKNDNIIAVTDFGAGSRVFKSNKRPISAIAKNAGISNKKARLLTKIVHYFKPKNTLEIGTSLGIGTFTLHNGYKKSNITTLEGCPETLKIAQGTLKKFSAKNINFALGDFNETIRKIVTDKTYDLIYFDGNHQKEPTIKYFEQCLKTVHNDSIFIFDDIYWRKDMTKAWDYIKNHHRVKVTIDTFYFGLVFFREEQQKEHFIIRV
jgi:predicted O-methyltransferase YrrM